LLRYLAKAANAFHFSWLKLWADNTIKDIRSVRRIRYFSNKYKSTHCLYFISNRIPFTKGWGIPVVSICPDLFWHVSPLTYPPKFSQEFDESLLEWLSAGKLVVTVSRKTKKDLLTIFPTYSNKVKAIPSASNLPAQTLGDCHDAEQLLKEYGFEKEGNITFYFPSSFTLYKDHLTLMRAALGMYSSGQSCKILLTGIETDRLVMGDLNMSRQRKTSEYESYLSQLRELYMESQSIWKKVFYGLGYCGLEVVEAAYKVCDCVVMPSQYEGFGLAIAEAVTRGLPIISADLEVFREQVEIYQCSDRVRFFPVGNANALQQCLEEFLHAPVRKLSLVEAANRFSNHTWRQVAEEYIRTLSML
jgi:glycosyltransferase involved in cell wall biosynthesis